MRFFFIFGLLFSFPMFLCSHDRLKTISVFQNSSDFNDVGYDNFDGGVNGENNLIKNVVRSGDVVFDVGANIGSWSKYILATNKDVRLYAFEPIPATFNILEKELNFQNVRLYNMAISQKVGNAEFFVYLLPDGSSVLSSLYYRPVIGGFLKEKIVVETQSLDFFCNVNRIDHVDFLKIDTEGAEWFVFLGAQDLLSRKAIKLIQFEYGGTSIDAKTNLKQMYELLRSEGYSVYRIVPNGLVEIKTWDSKLEVFRYSNYFASINEL